MVKECIRVLNVNMSIDPIMGGGTAARTVQMSKALVVMGNQCSILSLDIGVSDDTRAEIADAGVKLITLGCLSRRFYIPSFDLRKISRAVEAADIIHLMGHWTLLNVLVYMVILFHGKPYVVCPAGALPLFGRSRLLKRLFNFVIGKRIIYNANGHIAVTNDEKSQFTPYGIESSDIDIIPNGINLGDFKSENVAQIRDYHRLGERPIILFVGRLNYIKGPDLLLQAYSQLGSKNRDFNLVFVGPDGGLQQELMSVAKAKNLDGNIYFIGYLGGDNKSDMYHAADFLVIPSRQEAMSIVALEAGACRTPVLLTAECGFNDVQNFGGGLVVDASIDAIRGGLQEMIGRNDRVAMGQKLFDFVSLNYTWGDVAIKIDYLYRRILRKI